MSDNTLIIVVGAVFLALLIAFWIMRRPGERIRAETPDVLTPGAAPAERNTLLVDAPPAAAVVPPTASVGMAGLGEIVTAGAADVTDDAKSLSAGDDLTRIKGVGPKLSAMLRGLGVTRYDQIAAWSEADVARIDPQLGAFQGRIARDDWIEQCRYLAAGDTAGFEARFGKV
jgi:predicted flap endonuclease-1-like 5' DNA nuclease